MSHERLEESLRIFYEQMEERLAGLTDAEKQQYLEGLVHAFDAVTRFCKPDEITPLERESFISSAKSWAYSRTDHLKLDPETRMRPLVESDGVSVAKSFIFAAKVQQDLLKIPLTFKERMRLQIIVDVAELGVQR